MIKKDKKAQEFSIATLVVLVLSIAVLVIVVLGIWKGWDYVFGKIGFLPNELTTAVTACKTYADNTALTTAFCEYKSLRINGVKGLWNCNGILVEAQKSTIDPGFASKAECSQPLDYCASIRATLTKDTVINGEPCKFELGPVAPAK